MGEPDEACCSEIEMLMGETVQHLWRGLERKKQPAAAPDVARDHDGPSIDQRQRGRSERTRAYRS
jgi:hypothetical protein